MCQVQQRLTVSDRPNLDARLQARGWISEPKGRPNPLVRGLLVERTVWTLFRSEHATGKSNPPWKIPFCFTQILGSIYRSIYRSISPCSSSLASIHTGRWNEIHASSEKNMRKSTWLWKTTCFCRSNQYSCQLYPHLNPWFFWPNKLFKSWCFHIWDSYNSWICIQILIYRWINIW